MPKTAKKTTRKPATSPIKGTGTANPPPNSRRDEVQEWVQTSRNQLFMSTINDHVFRFEKQAHVLTLSGGLWYEGKITEYYRQTTQTFGPEVVPGGAEVKIPTYLVECLGWPKRYKEELPENELILTNSTVTVDLVGILVAHEWNMCRKKAMGCTIEELGNGVWILPDETYKMLDKEWQERTDNKGLSFAQFVGRDPVDP